MAANIKDVARAAGLSISTVSKALNNYQGVSQDTKTLVKKVADELNYVPNRVASALSSKRSFRVGVVVYINKNYQAIDELNMQYILGVISAAKELNLEVVPIFDSFLDGLDKDGIIQYFNKNQLDSIILFGLNRQRQHIIEIIEDQLFKVVLVDASITNASTSAVSINHTSAQADIIQELSERFNIRNLLYIAGDQYGFVTAMRLLGVVQACERQHIDFDVEYGDFSERKAFELVLESRKKYDAIVCASDLMAIGASQANKQKMMSRIVTGFDGITLLGYIDENIITVKQNFFEIASQAVLEITRLLAGEQGRKVFIPYEIGYVKQERR